MTQKLLCSCAVENVSNIGVLLPVPDTGRKNDILVCYIVWCVPFTLY